MDPFFYGLCFNFIAQFRRFSSNSFSVFLILSVSHFATTVPARSFAFLCRISKINKKAKIKQSYKRCKFMQNK